MVARYNKNMLWSRDNLVRDKSQPAVTWNVPSVSLLHSIIVNVPNYWLINELALSLELITASSFWFDRTDESGVLSSMYGLTYSDFLVDPLWIWCLSIKIFILFYCLLYASQLSVIILFCYKSIVYLDYKFNSFLILIRP